MSGNFDINFEWDDPLGASIDYEAATWCRLIIVAGDKIVTRAYDRETESLATHICVPLYPVAEWLACNWWAIFHETTNPRRTSNGYNRRHYLRAGRDGYAFPNMSFKLEGNGILIEFKVMEGEFENLCFLESGAVETTATEVIEKLQHVIQATVQRLEKKDIFGTVLQKEWASICGLDGEEEDFCRTCGCLGVDPFTADDSQAAAIISVSRRIPSSIRQEFFGASSLDCLEQQAIEVERMIEAARCSSVDIVQFREIRESAPTMRRHSSAWHSGYQYARELRHALNVNESPFRKWSNLLGALNMPQSKPPTSWFRTDSFIARSFDGLVVENQRRTPVFTIFTRTNEAQRFAFCRALFDYLTGRDRSWLLTSAHTERQKRNRAFAAEFLAPADSIRSELSGGFADDETLADLADKFGVSEYVIRHQIHNHGIADVEAPTLSPHVAGHDS